MQVLLVWLQCASLIYQDTVWHSTPRTLRGLSRLSLRSAPQADPLPIKPFMRKNPVLVEICSRDSLWWWRFTVGGDTLTLVSEPPSLRWRRRYLTITQGPRTWRAGRIPHKLIEIIIPLAERPQTPGDTLWHYNHAWAETIAVPWSVYHFPLNGRITGLSLTAHYYRGGSIQYQSLALLVQNRDNPFYDEKVGESSLAKLPSFIRQRVEVALHEAPAYAYVVRIQDYYPAELQEAQSWLQLLREKRDNLPLPLHLAPEPIAFPDKLP
ncbi:MAG: hypothetical protein NZ580_01185 [Bacteroidia bacterium]|nr:hypothetical protein [Bacteroidia bacterium]MDW8235499.1 hypothetical protein [Bacteroidia bacterium]